MAGGLGFKCTHRILAMPPNSRVALGFPGPFQVLEIGTRTCALSCSEGLQGLQSHKPASGQGLEQVSQGSHHCQFRSGTLGTQLGSITEWVLGKFERPGSAFPKPCKPTATLALEVGTSVWLWPLSSGQSPGRSATGPGTQAAHQRQQRVDLCGQVSCLLFPCVHSTRLPLPGPGVLSVDPLLCKQASGWSARAAFQKVPWTGMLE